LLVEPIKKFGLNATKIPKLASLIFSGQAFLRKKYVAKVTKMIQRLRIHQPTMSIGKKYCNTIAKTSGDMYGSGSHADA
jgi:hypothetical protein